MQGAERERRLRCTRYCMAIYPMLRKVAAFIRTRIFRARSGGHAMSSPIQRVPVAQDRERFRLLFTNSRPSMPEGCKERAPIRTTRELIRERLARFAVTAQAQ